MANLRVKHEQIYNFPLQHIEPQVNWSTVIEEKQVPRGPSVPLAWPVAPAGDRQDLVHLPMEKQAAGSLGCLILGAADKHGEEVGCWVAREGAEVMGQGQLLWHQEWALEAALLAAAGLSEEKLRRIRGPRGRAPAWPPGDGLLKAQPGY